MNAFFDVLTERWSTAAEPETTLVLVLAGAVVVVMSVRRIWRVLRQASTIIHEMGHVLMAWVSGRRVSGIRLHSDTSGVTVSVGRRQGIGMLLTALGGYPAPGLLALGMAALLTAGHAGAALTLYQAVVLLALLLSRNAVGILSCLLSLGATGLIWWHNDPLIVTYTVVALAVFYAVAGVRGTFDVIRLHARRRPEAAGTDASLAARSWRALPLPPFLWLSFFLLVSVGSAAGVVWMFAG